MLIIDIIDHVAARRLFPELRAAHVECFPNDVPNDECVPNTSDPAQESVGLHGENLVNLIRMKCGNLSKLDERTYKDWPEAAMCVSEMTYGEIDGFTLRNKAAFAIIRVEKGTALSSVSVKPRLPDGAV